MENNIISNLQDLYDRLVSSYNSGVPFEQKREDRFAVLNASEIIKNMNITDETQRGIEIANGVSEILKIESELYESTIGKRIL